MSARALMLQGTGSDVGKSVLVAGLCRLARQRGIRVAPFKPQNMSNNAAACPGGGEIGRAQALQAQAAGLEPEVAFNPVLLKPSGDLTAQVVVHGEVLGERAAGDYMHHRGSLLPEVLRSFEDLRARFDLVLVEGAGSPAEVNLRAGDIANMGFAVAADVPVCLVADIDKGGVIASLVGTRAVLAPDDARQIEAYVINKFRGDPRLFDAGLEYIDTATGWASLGVLPWSSAPARLPAEDAVTLQSPQPAHNAQVTIVVPMLSRIANFDDFDPLRLDPSVDFRFIAPGQPLPADADVVLLAGTKATLHDLAFLRAQGWHHDMYAHVRRGGHVLGICGGYQMLGRVIEDAEGADGGAGHAEGLGLLDVVTRMRAEKTVRPVDAVSVEGDVPISGYEIHMGETTGPDTERPLLTVCASGADLPDGARNVPGNVSGTYLHGLFANDAWRSQWLAGLGAGAVSQWSYADAVESALDEWAAHVAQHMDVERLFAMAR